MPRTLEGVGTWYWGKTNIFVRRSACEHCGHQVELRSFDTTKYFVFFFVPLIPLGRKRVTDLCPKCTQHACAGLNDWRQNRDAALDETQRALADDPKNEEAAAAAITAAVLFQDRQALDKTVARLRSTATESALQSQLLGHAYSYFGRHAQAESALAASLKIKDDESVRDSLAFNLLLQGKPDKAWPYLQPVLDQQTDASCGLVLLAAESYQTWGMHEAALKVLDEYAAAFPAKSRDKDYRRLRKVSEKHLRSGKKIGSPILTPGAGSAPVKTQSWRGALPRLVLPILLLAFALSSYWMGRSHEVILINGLDREYRVSLNGIDHILRPAARTRITVPKGELTVRVLTPNLPIPEQSCRIQTPFFTRWFSDHTFILNPDRTALLLWQEVQYAERPQDAAESTAELHVGKLLSDFTGVDYLFEEFPDSIRLESGSKISKQQISLLPVANYNEELSFVFAMQGKESMLEHAKRKAQYESDVEAHIVALWNLYPVDEMIPMLSPLLPRRPVCL
ncbi:MAG: hypothetical protein O7D94_12015, partial [Planctomycetota bacterium]|nr:hypothetical protein [Planctomycetota bacterium]